MIKSVGNLVFMAALSLACLNIAAAPTATVAGTAIEPAGQSGIVAGTVARATDKIAVSRSLPRKLVDEFLRTPSSVAKARAATRPDRDLHFPPEYGMRESVNLHGRSGCYFDPVENDDGPATCGQSCQHVGDCRPHGCRSCLFVDGIYRPGECI